MAELKQFCKEEWAKIPPQRCERLIDSYRLIAVVAAKGAATSLGGNYLFHVVPGRFGKLFPLNKFNCVYSGYLCVIYNFI